MPKGSLGGSVDKDRQIQSSRFFGAWVLEPGIKGKDYNRVCLVNSFYKALFLYSWNNVILYSLIFYTNDRS